MESKNISNQNTVLEILKNLQELEKPKPENQRLSSIIFLPQPYLLKTSNKNPKSVCKIITLIPELDWSWNLFTFGLRNKYSFLGHGRLEKDDLSYLKIDKCMGSAR